MSKYIFLALLVTTFAACTILPPYKIVERHENLVILEIPRRIPPDTLQMIAHRIRKKYGMDEMLVVEFRIPSQYPRYPQSPWSQLIFSKAPAGEMSSSMRVFGSRTDLLKKLLLEIPAGTDAIGKWYNDDPAKEHLYIITENDTGALLKIYDVGIWGTLIFEEGYDTPWTEALPEKDFPREIPLVKSNQPGRYYPLKNSMAAIS